jgi:hypothetical protein
MATPSGYYPHLVKDSTGRGRLSEDQMHPIIARIKERRELVSDPPKCDGRGIITVGGGKYLAWAWVLCRHLRNLGWTEGIQIWHLGAKEMPEWAWHMFKTLNVDIKDAQAETQWRPMAHFMDPNQPITWQGWKAKAIAVINCPWRHVMFIDADCFPVLNPAEIFNHREIKRIGSIFYSDVAKHNGGWGYIFAGVVQREKEWETGAFLIDKVKCWLGLRWWYWFCEQAHVWFRLGHGEKFVAELGIRMSNSPHLFSEEAEWKGWGIEHSYQRRVHFQHLMGSKRQEYPLPDHIQKLFMEWVELTGEKGHSYVPANAWDKSLAPE